MEAEHDIVKDAHLVRKDECAEEDPLIGPLLERDLNVGLGPVDVDEGNEDGRDLDLCLVDDVGHELEEFSVFRVARERAAARR